MNPKNYLSSERQQEITEELEGLRTTGRKEVAERLKAAKELGDLSENSDYHEAREEQARLETRIAELEEILRHAVIVRRTDGTGAVRVGSNVKVKRNGEAANYTIVGSSESRPAEGLISNESPVGQGLLGKKVGDSVKVRTPGGEVEYEILSIE
jgi:transcription elongation factor GreA